VFEHYIASKIGHILSEENGKEEYEGFINR
jgi:hypothetical protein